MPFSLSPLSNEVSFTAPIAGVTGFSYRDTVLADGPDVYYRLNEASGPIVTDWSGNAHAGFTFGIINFRAPGALADKDAGYFFPLNQGYVETPGLSSVIAGHSSSLECWFTVPDHPVGHNPIVGWANGDLGDCSMYILQLQNTNTLEVVYRIGAFQTALITGVPVTPFAYHHAVLVYDMEELWVRFYLDGIEATAYGSPVPWETGPITDSTADFYIAAQNRGGGIAIQSQGNSVDEVAIYGHVLTPGRVAAHFMAASTPPLNHPTYAVEIAFTNATSGYWTLGVSALDSQAILGQGYASQVFSRMAGVRSFTTNRGRQQENGLIQTGTATVTMDNADGRFSPDNSASPYAPNVISGRMIRITANYRGVDYPLFVGWIEGFQPVDNGEMDGDVIITAHDWLGKANHVVINQTFPAQDEGQRISACMDLLADNGFPRVLDVGPDTLVGQSFASAVGVGSAPTTKPVLAASGSGSALLAGVHSVAYTWVNATGQESSAGPSENITVTAGQNIVVTLPALPVQYNAARIYVSLAAGSALLAYLVNVSGTSYTIAAYPLAFAVPPPQNTGTLINVQQHINDVLTAERGIFLQWADGSYHYENRHYRIVNPRSTTVQATFGQPDILSGRMAPGVLPYESLDYIYDERDIYNRIRVNASSTFEGEQLAADQPSIDLHDPRDLTIQSQCMGAGVAANLAAWLLAGYKDQHSRTPALHLDGDASNNVGDNSDLWIVMLSLEISARIHVSKTRPGSMNVQRDVWIEGIQHNVLIDQGGHKCAWQLGEVSAYGPAGVWVLGTSALDSGALLGTF